MSSNIKDLEGIYDESFRDSLATVDKQGKRIWLYPKKPFGRFFNLRAVMATFLLTVLFVTPHIKINGKQLMLFNILERRFIIFGIEFYPQDFYIFFVMMITFIVFIILFTVIYGRLWCGWACPQTIFMEMIFRRIEYWIEGDTNAQIKLNKADWDANKILKKAAKHLIFFIISSLIAHTFLSYIIGSDQVRALLSEGISAHFSTFVSLLIFTFVFYGVFAYLREQVCTAVCPYGRLQGVLLDKDSLIIGYDYKRGEPRHKITKNVDTMIHELPVAGDCVDCGLCVKVCPTGIDIRNGTQLECVNCTACIDVCDDVMTKVHRPTGLIRYDSHNGIATGKRNVWTPKVKAYTVVLTVLLFLNGVLLYNRKDNAILFTRVVGSTYMKDSLGNIVNSFNVKCLNKSGSIRRYTFTSSDPHTIVKQIGHSVDVKEGETYKTTLMISRKASEVKEHKIDIDVNVSDGTNTTTETLPFLGPFR